MLPLQLKSAATDGDAERLTQQLSRVSPGDRDEDNNTPLHYAAWGGATPLCQRLLLSSPKLPLDPSNDDGDTPLHLASRYGRLETVRFLLDKGANLHATDRLRYTPLHMAAEANWGVTGWEGSGGRKNQNASVCRLLLERGADPLALDSFCRTPLDVAASDEEIRAILRTAVQQKKRREEEALRKATLQVGGRPRSSSSSSSSSSSGVLASAPHHEEAPRAPQEWSVGEVGRWLEEMGLGRYAGVFAEKAINGRYLMTKLTELKLQAVVQDVFHRERIMDEIELLRNLDQARATPEQTRSRRLEEEHERRAEEERREREERNQRALRALKSAQGGAPTRITFENNLDNDVRIVWVDFRGEPQLKRFLPPLETYTEDTMEGHVWQVLDDRTSAVLKAVVASAEPLWVSAADSALSLPASFARFALDDSPPAYDQVHPGPSPFPDRPPKY